MNIPEHELKADFIKWHTPEKTPEQIAEWWVLRIRDIVPVTTEPRHSSRIGFGNA